MTKYSLYHPAMKIHDCICIYMCGEVCTKSCNPAKNSLIFFKTKCPHSLSCYLIFSLFTIKIIFKPDHFLFFPLFFKESLGQRENCWAETQSKADSAHASLFSIFIPAQLWLETSVSDSWWTQVPGISKHYIFTLLREVWDYVSSYISCIFREVNKNMCLRKGEGKVDQGIIQRCNSTSTSGNFRGCVLEVGGWK